MSGAMIDSEAPAAARLLIEPGQIASFPLLARGASIHVDFHAHRHFDNLRRFPGHSGLPSHLVQVIWREDRASQG